MNQSCACGHELVNRSLRLHRARHSLFLYPVWPQVIQTPQTTKSSSLTAKEIETHLALGVTACDVRFTYNLPFASRTRTSSTTISLTRISIVHPSAYLPSYSLQHSVVHCIRTSLSSRVLPTGRSIVLRIHRASPSSPLQ